MKKYCAVLLILLAAMTLSAQNRSNIFFFVPQLSGIGGSMQERETIPNMITEEVYARGYTALDSTRRADYILQGSLSPFLYHGADISGLEVLEDGWVYTPREIRDDQWVSSRSFSYAASDPSLSTNMHNFSLVLLDAQTHITLMEQSLLFTTMEEFKLYFPLLMNNIFSLVGGRDDDPHAWRNKRFYFGASAFWSPRVYSGNAQSTHITSFGGSLSAAWRIVHGFTLELGAELASDWVRVSTLNNEDYFNTVLELPVSIKYAFTPSDYFVLEPFAGVHFNIPLPANSVPSLVSWMVGFQYGVKAGPGILFINPRFSMDMGAATTVERPGFPQLEYQRTIIQVGIGYKIGVGSRPNK